MLSRTKVNYGWAELWRALWRREVSTVQRQRLRALLEQEQGAAHVLVTPSGRGGLYYLLRAVPHTRVVVPAYTCKAVTEAAQLAGKRVVHVDVDDGYNLSAAALAGHLDGDSVVIATHQFGIPCDIEGICAAARAAGALVFEDVAPALGTRIGGRPAGSFGDAAFFSFDSTKLVHVPLKAGFVTVRDAELFAEVCAVHDRETAPMSRRRKLALLAQGAVLLVIEQPALYRLFHKLNFELRGRFTADTSAIGADKNGFYTDRVAEWQAAIAAPQVERLGELVARRRELYAALREQLAGCAAIELPPEDSDRQWACIRFPVLVRGSEPQGAELADKLAYYRRGNARGIDFAFSFTFLAAPEEGFAAAHRIAKRILDLPFYQKLTARDVSEVVEVMNQLEGTST